MKLCNFRMFIGHRANTMLCVARLLATARSLSYHSELILIVWACGVWSKDSRSLDYKDDFEMCLLRKYVDLRSRPLELSGAASSDECLAIVSLSIHYFFQRVSRKIPRTGHWLCQSIRLTSIKIFIASAIWKRAFFDIVERSLKPKIHWCFVSLKKIIHLLFFANNSSLIPRLLQSHLL